MWATSGPNIYQPLLHITLLFSLSLFTVSIKVSVQRLSDVHEMLMLISAVCCSLPLFFLILQEMPAETQPEEQILPPTSAGSPAGPLPSVCVCVSETSCGLFMFAPFPSSEHQM